MLKKSKHLILVLCFIVFQPQFNYAQVFDMLQKLNLEIYNNASENAANSISAKAGKVYIPSSLRTTGYYKNSAKEHIYWTLKIGIAWGYGTGGSAYFYDQIIKKHTRVKMPIIVNDDYIEFNTTDLGVVRINYADILFDEIKLSTPYENGVTCRLTVNKHNLKICDNIFADALYYERYQYSIKYFKEQIELFKPVASAYLKLESKPLMAEEQRKLFVQGNALTEEKEFRKAIEYYNKAIAINPVAYPSGYYNLALIASIIKNYPFAIFCMQKYLMLVPDAPDAKEAQDKIYGWQALTK